MESAMVPQPNTKVLANGAVFDVSKGRIVSGAVIDSTQASALAKLRWDKRREAISEGMRKHNALYRHEYDAIEAIADHQMSIATTRWGRESTEAAKFLMRAGDFLPDNTQADKLDGPTDVVPAETVKHFLDVLTTLLDKAQSG